MIGGFMNMGVQGIKTAFITILGVGTIGGALLIGDISDSDILGTDPDNQVIIKVASQQPDATSDGLVFIGATDSSADSQAVVSFYQERDVSADVTEAGFSTCWIVNVNDTDYCVMMKSL